MRVTLGTLLIMGACASTNYISFGEEVEAEVRQVLGAPQTREAALIIALRETPYTERADLGTVEADVPRDVEVVFADHNRVVAWLQVDVFEAAYPQGTLHIERVEFPRDRPEYRVSLIQEKRVLYAGSKSGARIDQVWRRLSEAARTQSTLQIDGHLSGRNRPLASLHDIGVDFQGIRQ